MLSMQCALLIEYYVTTLWTETESDWKCFTFCGHKTTFCAVRRKFQVLSFDLVLDSYTIFAVNEFVTN